jgi:hypothetical protein
MSQAPKPVPDEAAKRGGVDVSKTDEQRESEALVVSQAIEREAAKAAEATEESPPGLQPVYSNPNQT